MNHKILNKNNQKEVTNLFTSVFNLSEGEKEGKLIGNLASKLSSGIDNQNIICFGTYIEESIIGSIFFTRLQLKEGIQLCKKVSYRLHLSFQCQKVGWANP